MSISSDKEGGLASGPSSRAVWHLTEVLMSWEEPTFSGAGRGRVGGSIFSFFF